MNRVHVLEQTFTSASEKFQLKFAEEASAKLESLHGVDPEPTGKALLLHADSELALDAAATVLRACYGEDLRAGSRRIRQLDNPPMEPIMDVLIRAPRRLGELVHRDLHRRGAVLRFKNIEAHGCPHARRGADDRAARLSRRVVVVDGRSRRPLDYVQPMRTD